MSDFKYSNDGPEPLRLPLILWEFRYYFEEDTHKRAYYARAGCEDSARAFCKQRGYKYDSGYWEVIEG